MDRTATRRRSPASPRTQAIHDLRAHGGRPDPRAATGSVIVAFAVTAPVDAVTVWIQSSGGFDVLTYRHFTAPTPMRHWDVAVPDLPAGTYDVTVDVPDPTGSGRESWSGRVGV